MRRVFCLATALCIAVATVASAAESPATITLIEGPANLLRGTTRFALAEGVQLKTGDIVEVGEKGLAQIEFADGAIISLGPRCRFYAASLAASGGKGAISDFYLMQGWTKFTGGKSAAPFRYTTPLFGLNAANVTVVVGLTEAEGSLFVETGELRLAEGFVKASPASSVRVRGGEYYTRKADQKGAIQQRVAPGFVAAMPKSYLDNLPVRVPKFKEREVAPRRVEELTYAEVEMWLKSPFEIRRPIMRRFIEKKDDPAFRQAVIANMKYHPEWDRVLFPEKYEKPKPPPEPPLAKPPEPLPEPLPQPPPQQFTLPQPEPLPQPAPRQTEAPSPQPAPELPPVTVEGAGSNRPPKSQ